MPPGQFYGPESHRCGGRLSLLGTFASRYGDRQGSGTASIGDTLRTGRGHADRRASLLVSGFRASW